MISGGGESRHRVGAVDMLNVLNVLQASSPAGKGGPPPGRGASKGCRRRQQPQAVMAGHSGERLVTVVTHGGRWP